MNNEAEIAILQGKITKNLKEKFETTESFRKYLVSLGHHYGRKLIKLTKNPEVHSYIEDNIGYLVKSQFFSGYLAMKSFLELEQTEVLEPLFNLKKGALYNEVPTILLGIMEGDDQNWHRTDISHTMSIWFIENIENAHEIVKQMRKDLALNGSFEAIIDDSRYIGDKQEEGEHFFLLGTPYDITFLTPQIYMQPNFVSKEHEIWNLYSWSSMVNGGAWLGSIHFSTLPISENQKHYLFEFNLLNLIQEDEMMEIVNKLSLKLPKAIRSLTQIQLNQLLNYEVLTIQNDE